MTSLSETSWPCLPASAQGRQVVLHTRVVTETGGGPDKTIFYSAPFLADSDYWVLAAYMHPPGDSGFEALRQRAANAQCPLIGVPDRGPTDRSVIRSLLNICKKYDVRLWHGHDYKSNMLGLMLRPFWKMKLVTTLHGWVKHTNRTPLYYAIDRWCLPYYQHVFAVSDDLHEQALRCGVKPERLTLLWNGIDEQRFVRRGPASDSPMRTKLGTPAGRKVIGGMGRLSQEKAFNHLIHAVESLVKQGLDLELWIAGDGECRSELQMLAEKVGLADRVKLLGFCDDTIAFYESLDLFVLSSLREGLPNVVLEAMSMSLPVVSTAVAGVPKLITHEANGLLCPMGDVVSLSQQMQRVTSDQSLADRLAQSARQTIEQRFTFRRRMDIEKAVYDRMFSVAASTLAGEGTGAMSRRIEG